MELMLVFKTNFTLNSLNFYNNMYDNDTPFRKKATWFCASAF